MGLVALDLISCTAIFILPPFEPSKKEHPFGMTGRYRIFNFTDTNLNSDLLLKFHEIGKILIICFLAANPILGLVDRKIHICTTAVNTF